MGGRLGKKKKTYDVSDPKQTKDAQESVKVEAKNVEDAAEAPSATTEATPEVAKSAPEEPAASPVEASAEVEKTAAAEEAGPASAAAEKTEDPAVELSAATEKPASTAEPSAAPEEQAAATAEPPKPSATAEEPTAVTEEPVTAAVETSAAAEPPAAQEETAAVVVEEPVIAAVETSVAAEPSTVEENPVLTAEEPAAAVIEEPVIAAVETATAAEPPASAAEEPVPLAQPFMAEVEPVVVVEEPVETVKEASPVVEEHASVEQFPELETPTALSLEEATTANETSAIEPEVPASPEVAPETVTELVSCVDTVPINEQEPELTAETFLENNPPEAVQEPEPEVPPQQEPEEAAEPEQASVPEPELKAEAGQSLPETSDITGPEHGKAEALEVLEMSPEELSADKPAEGPSTDVTAAQNEAQAAPDIAVPEATSAQTIPPQSEPIAATSTEEESAQHQEVEDKMENGNFESPTSTEDVAEAHPAVNGDCTNSAVSEPAEIVNGGEKPEEMLIMKQSDWELKKEVNLSEDVQEDPIAVPDSNEVTQAV